MGPSLVAGSGISKKKASLAVQPDNSSIAKTANPARPKRLPSRLLLDLRVITTNMPFAFSTVTHEIHPKVVVIPINHRAAQLLISLGGE